MSLQKGTNVIEVEYWAEPFIMFDTDGLTSKYYLRYLLEPLKQWDEVNNITISITPPSGWLSEDSLDGKTHTEKWTHTFSELPGDNLHVELSPPVPNTSFDHLWAVCLIVFMVSIALLIGRLWGAKWNAGGLLNKLLVGTIAGVVAFCLAVLFIYASAFLDIYHIDQYTSNRRRSFIIILVWLNMAPFVLIASFIGFLLAFFVRKRPASEGPSNAILPT